MTTRRGGSSLRGGWSGAWAGITSTIMFWVILYIGLFVLLAQRIEVDTQKHGNSTPPNEVAHAWHAIQPAFPNYLFAHTQSPLVNLLLLLGCGILLASTIGWFGGMLGTSQRQKKLAKKQSRLP